MNQSAETTSLLELKNLIRSYQQTFTVGPVNLSIMPGEVIAIMGANGAGKSTLYQMITGNSDATSGEIFFKGKRLLPEKVELKKQIGYLPQDLALPKWVTPLDALKYSANLYGSITSDKIKERLEVFSCMSYKNRPLQACSHGMQKRAGLAISTIHDPDLLILDEPFSGLDIIQTKALEDVIFERQAKGKSTILSTHIPPYVAKLCSRCVVIQEGSMHELDSFGDSDYLQRISMIEHEFFGKDA